MQMVIDGYNMKDISKASFFSFPDGQPHAILKYAQSEVHTIRCSIRNPNELIDVMLINDVLRRDTQCRYIDLEIGYLMGARMDRPIDQYQPFTLNVVVNILNSGRFNNITLFNAHSDIATRLLRAANILPINIVKNILRELRYDDYGGNEIVKNTVIPIAPDKGASKWVSSVAGNCFSCNKVREEATGKLSGFGLNFEPVYIKDRDCLIIDDICDGGGTFIGISNLLKESGARKVYLYVTHGIFSKGIDLNNIDHIFTTNSYWEGEQIRDLAKNNNMPITIFDVFSGERIYEKKKDD